MNPDPITLRRQYVPYREIAATLGMSLTGVYRACASIPEDEAYEISSRIKSAGQLKLRREHGQYVSKFETHDPTEINAVMKRELSRRW